MAQTYVGTEEILNSSIKTEDILDSQITAIKLANDVPDYVLGFSYHIVGVNAFGVSAPSIGTNTFNITTAIQEATGETALGVVVAGNETVKEYANVELRDVNGNQIKDSSDNIIWGRVVTYTSGTVEIQTFNSSDVTASTPTSYSWSANEPTTIDIIFPQRIKLSSTLSHLALTRKQWGNSIVSEGDSSIWNAIEGIINNSGVSSNPNTDPDYSGTNYITSATTLLSADILLDSQVFTNASAITNLQSDVTNLQSATGVSTLASIDYTSNNYISDATTLKVAIEALDGAVKSANDSLTNHINSTSAHAASSITYNNTTSGMSASVIQSAIDELDSRVDAIEAASGLHLRAFSNANGLLTGSINSTNPTFALSGITSISYPSTMQVYVNGVFMMQGASYDYVISGNTITFSASPRTGSNIMVLIEE